MLRALETFGPDHLEDPEQLRYIFGPLIARNAREQNRFHQVFKEYLEDARNWEIEPLTPRPRWRPWLFALLPLLLTVLLFFLSGKDRNDPSKVEIICPPSNVVFGENFIAACSTEEIDTLNYTYRWILADRSTAEEEQTTEQVMRWEQAAREIGNNPNKTLSLEITRQAGGEIIRPNPCEFTIVCPDTVRPAITAIHLEPARVQPGIPVTLSADIEEGPFDLKWEISDRIEIGGREITHIFDSTGTYSVELQVRDTSSWAICEHNKTLIIQVKEQDEPIAVLNSNMPILDETEVGIPIYRHRNWVWGLLFIPFFLTAYFWQKWWHWEQRKRQEKKDETDGKIAVPLAQDHAKSRRPYFIPFLNLNQNILPNPSEKRLAESLRHRDVASRQVLDVPRTLQATIGQAGFPTPRFRYDQLASEYLLLVDRQSANSHQADLFRYLVDTLEEHEAYIRIFYFDSEFYRFWNEARPEGVDLDFLLHNYANYRLIVLGDGHALINMAGEQVAGIRSSYLEALQSWQQRILITPLPARSWTYREIILNRHFVIFPADSDGLEEAAHFIRAGLEKEDLPPGFREWQQKWIHLRQDPDTNYVDWNDLDDLKDHFRDRQDLFQWLAALVVYPNPKWPMTVAVGKALEAEGVVRVTYDNLLQLSRVEWLQSGLLDHSLRYELIGELKGNNEKIARQAVIEQLAEIQKRSDVPPDSHAGEELKTHLAVQRFIIAPATPDNQYALQILLEKQLLSPEQIEELNNYLRDFQEKGKLEEVARDISTFVNRDALQVPETEELLPRNPNLWPAAIASILLLISGFGLIWSNQSELLARLNNSNLSQIINEPKPEVEINNQAVGIFQSEDLPDWESHIQIGPGQTPGDRTGNPNRLDPLARSYRSLDLFRQALALNPNYTLARRNLEKARFKLAASTYWNMLNPADSLPVGIPAWPRDSLLQLVPVFSRFMDTDSLRLDSWHALGLINFYVSEEAASQNNFVAYDSLYLVANNYYDSLSTTPYFDDILTYPNLHTLLSPSDTFQVNQVYCIMPIMPDYGLAIRNKVLIRSEITSLNPNNRNTPQALELYNSTYIGGAYNNEPVRLLADHPLQYEIVSLKTGKRGYIVKIFEGQPTLTRCETDSLTGTRRELNPKPDRIQSNQDLELSSDQNTVILQDSSVQLPFAVNGQIIDERTALPLPGVTVWFLSRTVGDVHGREELRDTSDAYGNFQISGFHPKSNYELRLAKEGYGLSRAENRINTGENWANSFVKQSMLRLQNNLEVSGRIVEVSTQQAISGAIVSVTGKGFSAGGTSDQQGQFSISVDDADINTSSFNVIVARQGYVDQNFSINNYKSGAVLELELSPETDKKQPSEDQRVGTVSLADQNYPTIQINEQFWLTQNLNYEISGSFCFENNSSYCARYGRLYTWKQAQQACRELGTGWRLPNNQDWDNLFRSYGGGYNIDSNNRNDIGSPSRGYEVFINGGTSDFQVLLGGWMSENGRFQSLNQYTMFWSATESQTGESAYQFGFDGRGPGEITRRISNQESGHYCRCVQDLPGKN